MSYLTKVSLKFTVAFSFIFILAMSALPQAETVNYSVE